MRMSTPLLLEYLGVSKQRFRYWIGAWGIKDDDVRRRWPLKSVVAICILREGVTNGLSISYLAAYAPQLFAEADQLDWGNMPGACVFHREGYAVEFQRTAEVDHRQVQTPLVVNVESLVFSVRSFLLSND